MPVLKQLDSGRVPVKIYTDDVEASALAQLENLAKLEIVHGHIAAMPDVHAGIGATVGSVIPTRDAIIPAAVGVDIGCGMNAVRTSLTAGELPDNLRRLRSAIEKAVPVGFEMHKSDVAAASTIKSLSGGFKRIVERHPSVENRKGKRRKPYDTWVRQLGTLGGGNHFIELCLDQSDAVWIMLHSGSRGVGNIIGRYFIEIAKKDMGDRLGSLPDRDLAWFDRGQPHFDDYFEAVQWAQDYALLNRREMMRLVVDALARVLPAFKLTKEAVDCHHNYVSEENHFGTDLLLTRKGAISARDGQLGIIPGSMGAKSYIVKGLGNPQSFHSCAHGAGRRMSRTAARKRFTSEDVEEQTRGVECRKDDGVVDEIPSAYKDIDTVMQNQTDLVEVVHQLRQFVCVKG